MGNSKKPVICIIGPCLKMGGMERASANLANSIFALGCDTIYIALFKQEIFFKLDEGIRFYEPSDFNEKNLSIFKTITWVREKVKLLNPDSIVVFNKFYSALVLVALTRTKFKVYISERSSPLFDWGPKLSLFNALIYIFWKPKGIIAQTSVAADFQRKYYGHKVPIRVIPNALRQVQRFPEIKRENIVLAVGRFNDPLKGFDRLLESFSKVEAPNWKLVFAGGDEDGIELKTIAHQLGLSNRVEYLGQVKNMDMVYARASIFVIPSRSEGFPNALCEAMAAGLPCIAFDFVAGPRDLIESMQNGIIIENGNILAMAEAIETLINTPDLRSKLGKTAEAIQSKLEGNKVAHAVMDFIGSSKPGLPV